MEENLKTQEDLDEEDVHYNYEPVREQERKKLKLSMLSIIFRDHFKKQLTEDEVPLWRTDGVWCCPQKFCPVSENKLCDVCVRLCFNTELRDRPIRPVQ